MEEPAGRGAAGSRSGLGGSSVSTPVSKALRINFTLGFSDPLVSAGGFTGVSLAAGFFAAASVFPIVASNDRCGEGLSGVRTLV